MVTKQVVVKSATMKPVVMSLKKPATTKPVGMSLKRPTTKNKPNTNVSFCCYLVEFLIASDLGIEIDLIRFVDEIGLNLSLL